MKFHKRPFIIFIHFLYSNAKRANPFAVAVPVSATGRLSDAALTVTLSHMLYRSSFSIKKVSFNGFTDLVSYSPAP